jgi:hypothetical protein
MLCLTVRRVYAFRMASMLLGGRAFRSSENEELLDHAH